MDLLWFLPAFILLYMSGWYIISLVFKRYDIVDVAWGPGFIFLVWISYLFRALPLDYRSVWMLMLVSIWGLRLFLHTSGRNLRKEEDWRYHRWHSGDGWRFLLNSYIRVFLFQGSLMMITALPAVYGLSIINLPLFAVNRFGIFLMIFGIVFEAIADRQRLSFLNRAENNDRLITSGLWRYSRHPNYFGELLFWWGSFFLVIGAPKSWMLAVSPLIQTYVIIFVSGLPMEEKYKGRADFDDYRRRTSALFPWFTKKAR
ncbi:MAG: DUF1295 domain-containing protein [Bacillota bacterium]